MPTGHELTIYSQYYEIISPVNTIDISQYTFEIGRAKNFEANECIE